MKVNKKQNSVGIIKSNNGKASQPRNRTRVRNASRNQNLQGSVAAAYSTGNSGRAPKLNATNESCHVQHRELLGNVSSANTTGAYNLNNTFALNPGLPATFKWLSQIAQNWETYRFNSLKVHYYTRTGSNTKGSVIMAPDYDASDASPTNEDILTAYQDVREDGVWKDITCVLRPSAMHNVGPRKFVRTGNLSPNQDVKLYDVGNFFVATADSAVVESWGKLWIEYDVTFYTPQLNAVPSNGFANTFVIEGAGGGFAAATPYGATPTVSGGIPATVAGLVITIPSGLLIGTEYFLASDIDGTTVSVWSVTSAIGLTIKTGMLADPNAAQNEGGLMFTFTATAVSGSITLLCTAVAVAGARAFFNAIPTVTI